ncbi:MAG TPA: hypothetical protein VGC94_03635 [Amnibacterium sp.]
MPSSALQLAPDERARTVEELQARISAMQATGLGTRTLPTRPELAPLLPGGALQAGVAYAVPDSLTLAMLLMAGPSAAGGWCAVIGVPDFGIEAAAGFGVDLDRLVLVPQPGEHWLAVAAQVADVLPVVLLRPPASAAAGDTARLASRLRQRGSTLLVLGPWAQAEATLEVSTSAWTGIGTGSGYLAGRDVTVTVTARDIRSVHPVRIRDDRWRIEPPAVATRLEAV